MALSPSNGSRQSHAPVAASLETRFRDAAEAASRNEWEESEFVARHAKRLLAESGTLAVFQDALMEIVQDSEFKRSTYRMLLILFTEIKPANYIDWSAHGLAKKYDMDYSSALAAWKVLVRKDWLRRVVNEYGYVRYRLSPHLCWRGRPWKARIAQKNWDAEAQLARIAQTWDTPRQDA